MEKGLVNSGVIGVFLLGLFVGVGLVVPSLVLADREAGIVKLKRNYMEELLSGPVTSVEGRVDGWERALAGGSWPDINYEDRSRTGFQHSQHLSRMFMMARVYRHPESQRRGDRGLRDAILSSLDYWLANDFLSENWWHNEIGTPQHLVDVLLLMDEEISPGQREAGLKIVSRANLQGFGARPGGDLVKIAEIMVRRGLVAREDEVIDEAVEAMLGELRITTGRGIQPDHSFHHRNDGVIQNTSYGSGYVSAVADYAAKAAGTAFAIPDDRLELLVDHTLDGIRWSLAHGVYRTPASMNRDITRRGGISGLGSGVLHELMRATEYRREEMMDLVKVRMEGAPPTWQGNRYFWRSTFHVHQGVGYHAALRMYSSRNHSTEGTFNGEGLKNHHLADGSLFIVRTGTEYRDLMPVWDWQKIPGTTVVWKPELPPEREVVKKGKRDFVGGVSDGTYGFSAFDFDSPHDPLQARKAWFFLDGQIVALGSGISSTAEHPVVTTLNQSRLNGKVIVGRDGRTVELDNGSHQLSAIDWIHHDGTGYFFPAAKDVHIDSGTAAGNWRRINHSHWATEERVEEEVFTLWLEHGTTPSNEGYAYTIVPGIEAAEASRHHASRGIGILNTPEQQGIQHLGLGLTMLAFYEPGQLPLSATGATLTVEQACLIMVRVENGRINMIAVADPTQKLSSIEIGLSVELAGAGEAWDANAGMTRLKVALPGAGEAGKSVVRHFPPES